MKLSIYDLETYPNCFLFVGKLHKSEKKLVFEISDRKNDIHRLLHYLNYLKQNSYSMVGFNNIGFDYPLIHRILERRERTSCGELSDYAQSLINKPDPFFGWINHYDRIIPQIDLYKINHFDNKAKSTSLKALQFAMRSESVEDLPFPIRDICDTEKDILADYALHDLTETEKFLDKNLHLIEMRKELQNEGVIKGDVLNFSDVKIGSEYFIEKLGRDTCFSNGKPRQTKRDQVVIDYVLSEQIYFNKPEYIDVMNWFKELVVKPKSDRPKLKKIIAGLEFHFGLGGVHASVEKKVFESNDEYMILDMDVEGMYPSVSISGGYYPEHLGERFVKVYKNIKEDRLNYAKGSSRNKTLKLAGNGVYGKSSDEYSPFFDPKYTFTITCNGQLLLLKLIEQIQDSCQIIQANTDGTTVKIKRSRFEEIKFIISIWEKVFGLKLELVEYKNMWIADVNNYLAIDTKGKVKRKGRYWYPETDEDYEGNWNKNFSALAVQKAAELSMIHNLPVETFLEMNPDPFDFMLRYKAKGSDKIFIGQQEMSKTVRYYISKSGSEMKKLAKGKGEAGRFKRKNGITDQYYNQIIKEVGDSWDERINTKNKSKHKEGVVTNIESGFKVKGCNNCKDFNWFDLDVSYYIKEAQKLIIR